MVTIYHKKRGDRVAILVNAESVSANNITVAWAANKGAVRKPGGGLVFASTRKSHEEADDLARLIKKVVPSLSVFIKN